MNWHTWLVGVAVTLWLAYMSAVVRRWWPLFWLAAIFFGMGAGLVIATGSDAAAGLWWVAWMIYAPALPVFRQWRERRSTRTIYDET